MSLQHPRPMSLSRTGSLYSPLLSLGDTNTSADRERMQQQEAQSEHGGRFTWLKTASGDEQSKLKLQRRGALVVKVPRRGSGKWVRRLEVRV